MITSIVESVPCSVIFYSEILGEFTWMRLVLVQSQRGFWPLEKTGFVFTD